MRKIQTFLIPSKVYNYMRKIRKIRQMPRPALLLLNGGVWNVLRLVSADPQFQQYTLAVDQLLHRVEEEFPDVTVVWVGMTAMHIHRAQCLGSTKAYACYRRIIYMSSSRAQRVAQISQQIVARHPRVHYLPMYNRTYVSAHCARPADGRHYQDRCNARWWAEVWGDSTGLIPAADGNDTSDTQTS